MIFTSNFRDAGSLPGRISIARWAPRNTPAGYRIYRALVPTGPMLKMEYDRYRQLYFDILGKLDPQRVHDEMHELAGGADPILLCWEDISLPGKWCHRRLVAEWFGHHLGINVQEISKHNPRPEQVAFDFLPRRT